MASGVPHTIGEYEILEEIGRGGMGTLYRARDPRIGRDIAIKLLREGLDDSEMRERFVREARSAGRLKHGNIVTIFELGEHEGMPFIAMEYVQGQTLAALLKQKPTILLMRKLQMMDQVCAGLHYAHRMGIVHRDIKPANLMIDDEGTMKILDFGIARMGASKITHTGVVIGTLSYMSPEQMKGQPTDLRSDIFSIGAVFYELLSYRSPFAGDAPSAVMHKVLYGSPDPLNVICPNLDPSLVAIVTRCVEKLAANRYPDLGALRTALGAAMRLMQASGAETVLEVTQPVRPSDVEAARAVKAKTPASGSKDSANMDRMRVRAEQTRNRQILAHIENAQRALEQGSYDLVFAACEQALVLDPTNQQALDIEGHARADVDRLARERIGEARAEVERGALTAASMLVDQVLALAPDSADAQSVRQEIEEARVRLALEQERARERARALAQLCGDAERSLAIGSFEAAGDAVARALAIDAACQPAIILKDKVAKAIENREAQRKAEEDARARRLEDEARARKAIDEARRLFGAGNQAAAFTMLQGLAGDHPAAASALDALKLEAKEIERRRAEADRARLEEEAARLKRETEAARAKLEAELEHVKREREETRQKLEAEAAQLKREREVERQRADAERKRAEEERQKAEADRARLAREAEAARAKHEAEAARLAREAEAARGVREAEIARKAREDEAARLVRERERQAASLTEETRFDPRGANSAPPAGAAAHRKPPAAPLPQPAPLVSRPSKPQPIVDPLRPALSSRDLPKIVALGLMAVATLVIAAVFIVRSWGPSRQTVAPTPTPTPAQIDQASPPNTPPPSPPATEPLKQQHLAQLRQLLERGDYGAAIQEADQVLALEAGNPEAIQLRARAVELSSRPPVARGADPGQPQPAPTSKPSGAAPPVPAPQPPAPAPAPARNDSPAQRTRDLADRYARAKNALDAGQFSNAIALFEALQRDEPSYRDVPAELARARNGLTAAARQALDSGVTQERAGDLPGALQQFERARQIDPSQAAAADAAIARVRTRMRNEGNQAFTNARQYDALDRLEQAISAYESAVRYLPDDDPNKKIARERLAALRARRQ